MAEWKKVIVSGSIAELNIVSASGGFVGDGSGITNLVTTANVTTAGALMDSEVTNLTDVKAFDPADYATATQGTKADAALPEADVDADIKTLALPANTTISAFGKTLIDDADQAAAQTTLGVDAAGTDNSTNVTLAGTPNYITISGQTITRNTIDIGDDTNLAVSDTTGQTGINMSLSGDSISGVLVGLTTTSNVKFANITASGNISGSSTTLITAQDLTLNRQLAVPTITNVNTTHVTASGNISSSGTVYAENVFLPHAGGINFADTNTFIRGGTEDINIDGDNSVQLIGDNSVVFNTPHTVATGFIQATSHITSSEVRVAGHITASGNISASGTITANSFVGDGSGLTGIAASSFDFDGLSNTSVSNTSVVDADLFAFSDAGTEKKITYAQLYGNIFGELDGDISVTAGGAVTIAANSVALSTDTTGDYVATVTDAGAGAGIVIGGTSGEGAEASIKVDLNDLAAAAVDVAADSIAIIDANASNGSKKESIADLATAMASTGITATSGVFTTNDSEIDHDSLNNFSADEHFTQANITTVGTVTSGNVTAILPSGTVTGSAQVAMGGDISGNANNATVAKVQGVALTSGEATQLAAIDSVTITNTQWGYVGALNQSLTATSDVNFNDLTVAGDLTVQGDVIELQTTNLNIEDQFILLHSGSAANTSDSGIIFGGSGGTAQQGKALIWDSNYAASGEGRLAVRTTDLAANSTSDFAAGTTGYYVAGVFEGNSTDAATAKADHNGNIRIESNEIYIYA